MGDVWGQVEESGPHAGRDFPTVQAERFGKSFTLLLHKDFFILYTYLNLRTFVL